MALARVKTWIAGDTLTAADQNAEFNNILNNPISLISPSTGAINFQTSVAHTNLIPTAITASSGSVGSALIISSAATPAWGATPARSNVRGLIGASQGATVTLQADQYVLQTTATLPSFFTLASTAAFTVNVTTAGPIANGRDVAAAFSSTFVHIYAITTGFNSATPAGTASTTPPIAGPVLPTSYSAWCYLGTFAYSSASTNFTNAQRARGSVVYNEVRQALLTAGAATSETSVSVASLVPSIASVVDLDIAASIVTGVGGGGNNFPTLRAFTGNDFTVPINAIMPVASGVSTDFASRRMPFNSTGQTLLYFNTLQNSATSGTTSLWVTGYVVPNGDGGG